MISVPGPAGVLTLGGELERDRLRRRITRTTLAIAALRERAREHRPERPAAPGPIWQAIADFEARLAEMNARLMDLADGPGSTSLHRRSGR